MKIRTLSSAAMLALVLGLAGCGESSGGSVSDDSPEGSNSSEGSGGDAAEGSEQEDPLFGQTYTTESGVAITVGKPRPFKVDEFTEVPEGTEPVKFDVKLVNDTGDTFDPTGVYLTAQSGDTEAERLFAGGLPEEPSTGIRDGRQAKWAVAFAVSDPRDIVMDVDPDVSDFESEQVHLSHAVGTGASCPARRSAAMTSACETSAAGLARRDP